jgi:mitochondrial translocator assembly and maintenance protein 41
MLSTVKHAPRRHIISVFALRSLSTETTSSDVLHPPPPPSKHPTAKPRTRLSPAPRPIVPRRHQALPHLPATFGQNQLLSVSNSTRALLESIVGDFNAPIRYAFAYGSGVFEQDGYQTERGAPMLDFMFAVTHPAHFHSINMAQYPSHYAMYARTFGSSFVTKVQEVEPGVWFNAFVQAKGRVCEFLILCPVDSNRSCSADYKVRRHIGGQPLFRLAQLELALPRRAHAQAVKNN